MDIIELPRVVADFYQAHLKLKAHYEKCGLSFTLDGRLVGDIAEAEAALAFDLQLCEQRTPGVDAHTRCAQRRSVQVKSTGLRNAGPAFTPGEGVAEHLLFLRIDFERCLAEVAYNGPEAPIRNLLPEAGWSGTKRVSLQRVMAEAKAVEPEKRLVRIS